MNIEEYLANFYKFTKDPTLEVMYYLMNEFGNPHNKCKIIHVAGTNGKGSICEMLTNILIKQGYVVGKYMSPYLIKFNENISVNNENISDIEVEEILIKLDKKIQEYNNTHELKVKWFEVITSLAFIYFAQKNCDFIILETGLGGLTDCTNIVNPLISVIANIGYDHMDILGDTIEKITKHKAGIIKENSHTVFFNQEDETITNIIKETCETKNNNLHLINESQIADYSYNMEFQKFSFKEYKDVEVSLKGKKQINNASVCLECIDILKNTGYEISDFSIRQGLKTVIHKARFEVLRQSPTVIFDGGHNESAINNLKDMIRQYYNNSKKVFVISILKTKDYKTILKLLLEYQNTIYIFTSGNDEERYVSKEDLCIEAKKYIDSTSACQTEDLENALDYAMNNYRDYTIFVIGSFYTYKTVVEKLEVIK